MRRWLTLAALVGVAAPAWAHRPSDAALVLSVAGGELAGRIELGVRDLDDALAVDVDGDRLVTGRELRAAAPRIAAYVIDRLTIAGCPLAAGELQVAPRDPGVAVVLPLRASCAGPVMVLRYDLFFDIDPTHRGLLSIADGRRVHAAVISPAAREERIVLGEGSASASSSSSSDVAAFITEGVLHIWSGVDHVLFLLVLLLPAVRAGGRFREIGASVLKVVTAFTVAHSLTLALSVLGVVRPPERLVEVGIAVTVFVAALANLLAVAPARWPMAFYLGLLHGFGFSNVLGGLGVTGADAAGALFGFNVGVEVGQSAIVALFLPLAYLLRHTWAYRRLALAGGSLAVACIAAVWTVQRLG